MKKLSLIILGFIIGALATYFFCPRQADDMLLTEAKIVKPKGVITPAQAKGLNDNWTKYRQAANDSCAKRQGRDKDDRSTWWSVDDIKNYMAYSKQQTDSLGYSLTGFRVYLGVYGNNAERAKKNLTTMFIVPTVLKAATAKASTTPFSIVGDEEDCPECDALNVGSGGSGGYPD